MKKTNECPYENINLPLRNDFTDACKAVACFFVVLIHCPFPGRLGTALQNLGTFAVPFFFVVHGRYLLPRNETDSGQELVPFLCKKLRRLLLLTLKVFTVYSLYSLFFYLQAGKTFYDWRLEKFNPGEWIRFFAFNSSKVIYDFSYDYDHQWYLFAAIYVTLLFLLLSLVAGRSGKSGEAFIRKLLPLLIILPLSGLFFGELLQIYYPIRPFDLSIRTWYMLRNWFFVGLPFSAIGMAFDGQAHRVLPTLPAFPIPFAQTGKKRLSLSESKKLSVFLLVPGCCLTLLESALFGSHTVMIGTLLMVLALTRLTASFEKTGRSASSGRLPFRLLATIGRKYSAGIYCWHVLLLSVWNHFLRIGENSTAFSFCKPFLLFGLTLLLSAILSRLSMRLRKVVPLTAFR